MVLEIALRTGRFSRKIKNNMEHDSFTDWLIDWLIDWWMDGWMNWLIDRLIDWLIDWSIDWLIDGSIDWLILYICNMFTMANGCFIYESLFCLHWSGHRFLGKFHFPNWQVILQPRSDCIIKCVQTPWPLWGRWFPAARRVHTKQAFMPLLPCQFSFNYNKRIIKIQNSKLKANKGRRRSHGQDTANLIAEMPLGASVFKHLQTHTHLQNSVHTSEWSQWHLDVRQRGGGVRSKKSQGSPLWLRRGWEILSRGEYCLFFVRSKFRGGPRPLGPNGPGATEWSEYDASFFDIISD